MRRSAAIGIYANILFILTFLLACDNPNRRDSYDRTILAKNEKAVDDSLLKRSIDFMADEISDLHSEKLCISNSDNEEVQFRLDTFENVDNFKTFIKEKKYSYSSSIVADSLILSNSFLIEDIKLACKTWQHYPWSRKANFETFKKFLLPYKVLDEMPGNWRQFFLKRYQKLLDSLAADKSTTSHKIYDKVINNDLSRWFKYKTDFFSLTSAPSFEELLLMKEGECTRIAYMNTYALRAAGVPATIDLVPSWGSKNGGHAEVVFMDSLSKMSTYGMNRLLRSAKVFRVIVEKNNDTSLSQYLRKQKDVFLPLLQTDHVLDVTKEHNKVSDVVFKLLDSPKGSIAYICVFDYGQWKPIFASVVDTNYKVCFKNMGVNILYRLAIPCGDSLKYIGRIFLLDSAGLIKHNNQPSGRIQRMIVHKFKNDLLGSWLRKGNLYSLYMLDKKDEWRLTETKLCTSDSLLVFENVRANSLYRLVKDFGNGRSERIFAYKNENQYWY